MKELNNHFIQFFQEHIGELRPELFVDQESADSDTVFRTRTRLKRSVDHITQMIEQIVHYTVV